MPARRVPSSLIIPALALGIAACSDSPTGGDGGGGDEGTRPEIVVAAPRIALVAGGSALEVPVVVRGARGIAGVEVEAQAISAGLAASVAEGPSDTVAVLRVQAADGALPNPAQLRLRATVPGRNVSDVVLVVPVRAAAAEVVTFAWCAGSAPTLAAVRDGADPLWTRVIPDAEGRTRFALPSGRGGIAWVRADGASEQASSWVRTSVAYGSAAELRELSGRESGACTSVARREVSGEAVGLAAGSEAQFALGTGWDVISDGSRPRFTLRVEGDAAQSLYAVRAHWQEGPWRNVADRMVVRRHVVATNGGTLAPVDFDGAEAFAPATGQVRVDGLLGDTAYVYGTFRNPQQVVTLSWREEVPEGTPVPVAMVPAARLAADERNAVLAASFRANTDTDLRGAARWFTGAQPTTVTLGPRVARPAPAGAGLALPVQAEYEGWAWANFVQHDQTRLREVILVTTAAWRDGATSWDVAPPALDAVSGWAGWWGLEPRAVTVGWGVSSEPAWWMWSLPAAGTTARSASAERPFGWSGSAWTAPAGEVASLLLRSAGASRPRRGARLDVGPGRTALPGARP